MAVQVRRGPSKAGSKATVRAQRFEIEDQSGNVRGIFGCSQDGAPSFRLLDDRNQPRIVLTLDDNKPRMRLLDSNGLVRLCIILRDDTPGIEYMDINGTRRLLMYLRPKDDENADLVFLGADGLPKLGLTTTKEGAILFEGEDELGRLVEPMWFERDLREAADPKTVTRVHREPAAEN
ncbi:MAG: hypothetical protein GIW99_09345 [Candidatus Eremiobacteraeota bacterium]|nr:hypothetical protein [Candidatus Eremiobacteraeota bacterium]MBC5827868.1 hypothetical protein [Candidatus Eremiobacteraeota bacterium]